MNDITFSQRCALNIIAVPVATGAGALSGLVLGVGARAGAITMALSSTANCFVGVIVGGATGFLITRLFLAAGFSSNVSVVIGCIVGLSVQLFTNVAIAWGAAKAIGLGFLFSSIVAINLTTIGLVVGVILAVVLLAKMVNQCVHSPTYVT